MLCLDRAVLAETQSRLSGGIGSDTTAGLPEATLVLVRTESVITGDPVNRIFGDRRGFLCLPILTLWKDHREGMKMRRRAKFVHFETFGMRTRRVQWNQVNTGSDSRGETIPRAPLYFPIFIYRTGLTLFISAAQRMGRQIKCLY